MLTPGTTLGAFKIVSLLGAGGMGEVYAAEDTRLRRRVALKILPPAIAAEAERQQRFEREAQTVASLSHPNIVTIHSVEHDGDVHFLTMELVEGKTLSEIIPRDGLPLDRLLAIAVQLADAVSAAHARGVIHRDLKPANVMVTADGRVKVLDFGLAKLKEPVSTGDLTTMAAHDLTGEGHIVGTVSYMSPEQAQGREIDHRTDIFSLGVMLYELATGQRPFNGESSVSIISSILRDTPAPVTELKPALPQELARIIRRCLAKEPSRRYQSALDLRNELEEVKQELDSGELTPPLARNRAGARRRYGLAAMIVAGVGLVVVGYLASRALSTGTVRVERFQLLPPPGIQVHESTAYSVLAVSPDGQWVAFLGSGHDSVRRLYIRSISEIEARVVPATDHADTPFFSFDSRWLAYFREGAIHKVPLDGGPPQRVTDIPGQLRGASWAADGNIVFSALRGLQRVSAEGGPPESLTTPGPGEDHRWPQVLPGGAGILFTLTQGFSDSWRKVAVLSLKTGEVRPLVSGTAPHYLRSGHVVYSRLGTAYAVGFDLERLELSGEPRAILHDVFFYNSSGYAAFYVSNSGDFAYIPGAPRFLDAELVSLDRDGRSELIVPDRRPYRGLAVAPTGDRFAVHVRVSFEDSDIWVYDTARQNARRLTRGYVTSQRIVWSRDGQWIYFTSFRSGHGKLYRVLANGGAPQQITFGPFWWDYACDITPDGKLLFMRQVRAGEFDLLLLPLDTSGAVEPLLATPHWEGCGTFSPDGRWLAYRSRETGTMQLHVRPYPPGPGPPTTVLTEPFDGFFFPFWSRDGRELFYRNARGVWSARVAGGPILEVHAPRLLFVEALSGPPGESPLTLSPDGQRFWTVRHPAPERSERLIIYTPNWADEVTAALRAAR